MSNAYKTEIPCTYHLVLRMLSLNHWTLWYQQHLLFPARGLRLHQSNYQTNWYNISLKIVLRLLKTKFTWERFQENEGETGMPVKKYRESIMQNTSKAQRIPQKCNLKILLGVFCNKAFHKLMSGDKTYIPLYWYRFCLPIVVFQLHNIPIMLYFIITYNYK